MISSSQSCKLYSVIIYTYELTECKVKIPFSRLADVNRNKATAIPLALDDRGR